MILRINTIFCVVIGIFSFALVNTCYSQNLVPNPDFETYSQCPPGLARIYYAIPWDNGNDASADYFHICSPGNAGVPDNSQGSQWPVSGVAYTGGFARTEAGDRDYIRAPLNAPLNSGSSYLVTVYVSVADEYCATVAFGVLFTVDTPYYENGYNDYLPYDPQIEEYGYYIGNQDTWTEISRCFIADGGEQYITIGNFRPSAECPPQIGCGAFGTAAYYYIDLVSVVEMPLSEQSFMMDPVTACDSFEIDPGQAQAYFWEDGTTNPTLTVFESGTYYVTISDECAFQYGEIEVTIIPTAPPVALPGDTSLCSGNSFEIALDGDAGDYIWQDGTQSGNYTITSSGVYSVSLTDACETTADTISVEVQDPPEFSLGADTLICDGDAFSISFDPSMGDFMWQDGSGASSYTINDDGTYALTITNMCGQAEDEIIVDFIEPIVFSIGPDQMVLCDGDETEIELDPLLGEFLWNDNSTDNTYTVTGEGTVSVTITNACESVSDEMLVSVLYAPEFTLGPDITVCSGQFPIMLNLSGVEYAQSWEWSGGSTQSIYQVIGPGTYSVTISNDCFAMSDEIVVSVGDVDPIVTLPADQLLCPGQTFVLDAGGLMGSYQWSTSTGSVSDADTFLVTEPGTYYLTVTNVCGSGSDSVNITFIPALTPPDLGPDFSLCPGETGVLYANVDDVSYLWTDVSTGSTSSADSLIITGPGTYTLQVSDACSSASDTIIITSDATPPDVDLPNSIDLCEGDTVILDAGITGVEYLWTDPAGGVSTGSTTAVSSLGTYTLSVSNACGEDVDSVIVTNAGLAPVVSLGADTALCPGDAFVLIPVSSDVQSWLWSDSSTSSTFNVQSSGTIIVNASNQCGQVIDTLVVSSLPDVPSLDLGGDISLCPGESQTLSINAPGTNVLWSDGSTDTSYQVTSGGLVYATISNACGESSDTVQVEVLDSVPALNLGNDQFLCPGETITIDPGIQGVIYLWQDWSTTSTYDVITPGLIILTISNACGSSTDSLEIIADTNGPQVDLGLDILACEGDTVILFAGISGVDYLWTDPAGGVSTSSTTAATVSGIYYLQVSNACGMDADTIVVDIHGTEPIPSLGPDTTLCDGEILTLSSNADIETTIEWIEVSTGVVSTSSTTAVYEPGMYVLRETNHCGSASDTIVIDFESAPEPFDLGEDRIICPGDTVVLTAPQTDADITWQDGSHGASFVAVNEQVYTLELSNDCGITSDQIAISFDENEPQVTLDSVSLCDGESIVLDAAQPFDAEYQWSTGSTSPSIRVTTPGDYFVSVMTDCYFTKESVQISSDDDCNPNIYIPNVFSPNGDGINDTWEVLIDPALQYSKIQCTIFDRWGDLVFETGSVPVSWDGVFNGKVVAPGVYVYVLIIKSAEGEKDKVLYGDLTLVR